MARLTPSVTAQALDYASWVVDLSHDQVQAIGDRYLDGGFELGRQGVRGAHAARNPRPRLVGGGPFPCKSHPSGPERTIAECLNRIATDS
jgi:hypothetical protein